MVVRTIMPYFFEIQKSYGNFNFKKNYNKSYFPVLAQQPIFLVIYQHDKGNCAIIIDYDSLPKEILPLFENDSLPYNSDLITSLAEKALEYVGNGVFKDNNNFKLFPK